MEAWQEFFSKAEKEAAKVQQETGLPVDQYLATYYRSSLMMLALTNQDVKSHLAFVAGLDNAAKSNGK